MAKFSVTGTTASSPTYGQLNVTWEVAGGEAGETLKGFEVLVDGRVVATILDGSARASGTAGLTDGNHTAKVRALVAHDISPVESTVSIKDGREPRKSGGAVKVTGTAKVGQVLTAAPGSWNGQGITFSFRWLRCQGSADSPWQVIAGATSETYTLVAADKGNKIRAIVIATTTEGIGEQLTDTTAVVT